MKELRSILERAVAENASDIFLVAGRSVSVRKQGVIVQLDEEILVPADTEALVKEIYRSANERDISGLETKGDDDFSFTMTGLSRFRVNAYRQRGALSAVIRIITFELPKPDQMGIPDYILNLCDASKGMVLVTGSAGSGKSTTLACMVNYINTTQKKHIITLEDPLEYLHRHDQSIVTQREISTDTDSYVVALRATLRQSPDVILLGEMRDYETISVAITAAETGHLVLSSLHTIGAASTVDRVIDVFPPHQQQQIRVQFANVLEAVVSQQLIPKADGSGRVAAFEVLHANHAVRNLIREAKSHQLMSVMQTNRKVGMIAMDEAIMQLYAGGQITKDMAIQFAQDPDGMTNKLH